MTFKRLEEDIFPADAGVNLLTPVILDPEIDIPRGCGGEPLQ